MSDSMDELVTGLLRSADLLLEKAYYITNDEDDAMAIGGIRIDLTAILTNE